MKYYYKIIRLTGHYYVNEFEKIKKHKNKVREIHESTVIKAFKSGNAGVKVVFEETDTTYTLDSFSDQELIIKYLGKNFI